MAAQNFDYNKDNDYINGLPGYYLEMKQNFEPLESKYVSFSSINGGEATEVTFKELTPGSVIAMQLVKFYYL